jgi:hypothetical protein
MSDQIIAQLKTAVDAHKGALAELRNRIAALLEPLPVGVKLSDDQGEILCVVRVCTGASQWANRTWDVTIKGVGYIHAGKLVAENLADWCHDGSNGHNRSTEPTCLYDGDIGEALRFLSGADTRAIAARLPEGIKRYMAKCEAETTANEATLN